MFLVGWWGSFRVGELLAKEHTKFDAKKDLLASDITFHEGSVSVWIRSPKVNTSTTGVVVEVWGVKGRLDLDPVTALSTFLKLRKDKFGEAEELPVFMHENGSLYSKQEMNRDLTDLLAFFPQLATSRDKWSGHSFRSGLSTILSLLGFSKVNVLNLSRPPRN